MSEPGSVPSENSAAIREALGWYFLLGFLASLLIPEEIAAWIPGVATATRAIEAIIPSISRLSAISSFPESMKAILTLMWLSLPIAAYRIFLKWKMYPRFSLLKPGDLWLVVASSWLIALVPLGFVLFFVDVSLGEVREVGGRGGGLVILVTQYRLGLATLGTTVFCCAAGGVGIAMRATVTAVKVR